MSIIYTPTSSVILTDPISPLISEHVLTPISPFQPLTLSFEFSKPIIGVYETIDTNPEVRKKMTDYYFDLIRDKWLLDEINDILNYFIYKDGKVSMIKDLSEYNSNNISKDTDQIAEKKVEFIENNIFNKYNLIEVLTKFGKEINSKWVDFPKHEFFLRQVVQEYIVKEIKKKIKGQK
ncbi:hypothetical protein QKU48_gp0320 [Fadolivirus algeromassiliense]|jgi:hypothetical protein|uniref:Uncharacterized protein n=1 Tax=Fadolivirus FV1/VV64 TaxID=3070911 RepID=A0A7D3R1G0_9VIRU|nr:hypothetical protein QKU48_gp0320 [Fadolivirus algeromassiliense]QKF93778.1 hypothetical protein Fadolivirus_1_320 [Fadolivirus FV1/VV64]